MHIVTTCITFLTGVGYIIIGIFGASSLPALEHIVTQNPFALVASSTGPVPAVTSAATSSAATR